MFVFVSVCVCVCIRHRGREREREREKEKERERENESLVFASLNTRGRCKTNTLKGATHSPKANPVITLLKRS